MFGISDGAVVQRGADGTCDFTISGCREQKLTYWGETGSGAAVLTQLGHDCFRVTGIPAGGPYTVKLGDLSLHDIYVGDVWILGGQSNMEGNGYLREADKNPQPDSEIRAFYMTGEWGPAVHPLHTPWKAADRVHRQIIPGLSEASSRFRGVGPGLKFAKRMKEITGVPQGILCCAHGGTTIEQWSARLADQGEDSLLGSLLKAVAVCGGNAAGLFWYQGCSEAMAGSVQAAADFSAETLAVFQTVRERINRRIPVVQAQISRMVKCLPADLDTGFSVIREQQRSMAGQIDRLAVISTVTEELDDLVHLSADSQDSVGLRAANAMAGLIYGEKAGFFLPPAYRSCRIEKDPYTDAAVLYVYFDHVVGGLHAKGRAIGFRVGATPYGTDNCCIFDTKVREDHAVLRLTISPADVKGMYLCYAAGSDPACNIFDGADRPIPAMAGVLIKE